ncbi:MAG TPA: metallophosphoesterase family protein [Candidatus Eisenbacteria bacterium]|nr:metallophosphoesterase family protein [Candidatus Eisenbacteria bacterium]
MRTSQITIGSFSPIPGERPKAREHTTGARWTQDGARARLCPPWPATPNPPRGRTVNATTLRLRDPDLEGPVAFLGGLYSNHPALRAVAADACRRGAKHLFCLGDLGGFGPNPGKVYPILDEYRIAIIAGNYDEALAKRLPDCGCGYTHPSDNFFAQLSYDYTNRRTTDEERKRLLALPGSIRFTRGGRRFLLCHGSPRKVNEFLWESACSDAFLMRLLRDAEAETVLCAHTGLHWQRTLPDGGLIVNAGAVGRPANDGVPSVWYALFDAGREGAEFIPVTYDSESLAREMEEEALPPEFIETIRTGWWTTCLEILPAKERARGKF